MRESLRRWLADADTRASIRDFRLTLRLGELEYLEQRTFDLYFALVGELFDRLRDGTDNATDWSALGNAFAVLSRDLEGATRADSLVFSSVAYYRGGYSASATLSMREANPAYLSGEVARATHDLVARPQSSSSQMAAALVDAIRRGDLETIESASDAAALAADDALPLGPAEWITRHLYAKVLDKFRSVNVRAVLPDGGSPMWGPLIDSFLARRPPLLEFFPSQIAAIDAGLLSGSSSFSVQMPTGSGKTALTEALLFSHLSQDSASRAVMLVPYRALARELRFTLGQRLTRMGLPTRTFYGGTVPSPEENEDLADARAFIATPESMTGLLGSNPELLQGVSLVICDEGHLLDGDSRGIGLELLLARFRARPAPPRMVFVSAIVPNIEEINAWLGGQDETVVRSDFRPASAEYAVLRPTGTGVATRASLQLWDPLTSLEAHSLEGFLQRSDFVHVNAMTGRENVYGFTSTKTRAVASARKSLHLGTVAVFAANKNGNQGVLGLAEELIAQLDAGISLPSPRTFIGDQSAVAEAVEYLTWEFGADWIGTRSLRAGAVVHHGDVPQETREVLEELLTSRAVPMVLCTSTLAEGVNLPIRTLVLYSVQRRSSAGPATPMLGRDIKNLVGRAGRAGSSTRGLVICANPNDWPAVRPVALGSPGERVSGALITLLRRLQDALNRGSGQLTNAALESSRRLFSLVDGIDSTLVELISDEIGEAEVREIARSVAGATFAFRQADVGEAELLGRVFELRAQQLIRHRQRGQLTWAKSTGARPRLIASVVADLYPAVLESASAQSPLDARLLLSVVRWALTQKDFDELVRTAYDVSEPPAASILVDLVSSWLDGSTYIQMATRAELSIDKLLKVHAQVVMHGLITLVEQGIALVEKIAEENGVVLSDAVSGLPSYLRHGVSSPTARDLRAAGLRHRRAAILIAAALDDEASIDLFPTMSAARLLQTNPDLWIARLGPLVFDRTTKDLTPRQS